MKNLIIIGIGTFECRNNQYFGKKGVVDYLNEISSHFDNVYLYYILQEDNRFKTSLSATNIYPIQIMERINPLHLIKDQIELIRRVNSTTSILIYTPFIWFTPSLPFLKLKSYQLSSYLGSNPYGIAKLQQTKGGLSNIFYSYITKKFGQFLFAFADSLIVRGDANHFANRSNVFVSKPITTFSYEMDTVDEEIDDDESILYVGGLYKNKGVDILIYAFKDLLMEYDNRIILKIVGNGEEKRYLENLVLKLGIDDRVKFLGWIDNPDILAKVYRASKIFVQPSIITEGSPRVIDESMYYGVPIIASNHKYEPSINKSNVVFITPGSVIELKEAILLLLKDSDMRSRLITNGKKRITELMAGGSAAYQHAQILKMKY